MKRQIIFCRARSIRSCPFFFSGGRGAGCAVFEQSDQLRRVAGGRQASLTGANEGERLVGGKMRQSFFQRAGKMLEIGARRDAQHGFAEAEDAMGGELERLRDPIVGRAGDDNLQRVMSEERGGESVGGGEKTILRRDAREGLESFLRGEAGSGRLR